MVSVSSTPGTSGWPGKCPSKTGLSIGTRASASIRPASRSRRVTRVDHLEIFEAHGVLGPGRAKGRRRAPGASRADRRQALAAFAATRASMRAHEVLQDEVLLGRHLALVDLLGPLLERQLDAEGLVDREGDVEEGERIDPEIVDGVALGRDRVARDVGGVGDDVRDAVEGGGVGLVGHAFSPCDWVSRRIRPVPIGGRSDPAHDARCPRSRSMPRGPALPPPWTVKAVPYTRGSGGATVAITASRSGRRLHSDPAAMD